MSEVAAYDIAGTIERALRQSEWGSFNAWVQNGIIAAHDSGHVSCGPTMEVPDAAAFDPLFWFFHRLRGTCGGFGLPKPPSPRSG